MWLSFKAHLKRVFIDRLVDLDELKQRIELCKAQRRMFSRTNGGTGLPSIDSKIEHLVDEFNSFKFFWIKKEKC